MERTRAVGDHLACPLTKVERTQMKGMENTHIGPVLPERGLSDSLFTPEGVGKPSFTARIGRPPPYRGGSASKKDGLRSGSRGSARVSFRSIPHPVMILTP